MNIHIKKLDDINILMSGSIEDSILREKITALIKSKEESFKDDKTLNDKVIKEKLEAIDKDSFQREAEEAVLQDFINQGIEEAGLVLTDTLGEPNFKSYEKKDNGLYLEVEISTQPHIDCNVEYMDIVPSYSKQSVDPKALDAKLAEMAEQQAPFIKVETQRAVQDTDQVIMDFEGFLNGKLLEGSSAKDYKLKIGSKSLLPGFEEQVIGMKVGEEKSIHVTFPKDYSARTLAGADTEFKVKLTEIQEKKLMEINDALAKRIFDDEEATLDTLKEKMAKKMSAQLFSNTYNETLKPAIIKGLLSKFNFTLPNNVIEQEIDAKINEKAQRMSKEEHIAYKEDKTKFSALRDTLRQEAKDSIKAALIVDALGKKEGIEPNDEEVLAALQYEAMMRGQDAEELVEYYKSNNLMTSAKVGLVEDKLFRKMLGVDL